MTLIKSISGIRGTIGGKSGDNLTPFDIVKFITGYTHRLKTLYNKPKYKVVVGRDGRISGFNVKQIVCSTFSFLGVDVVDIDYATTPATELAVTHYKADGGIIITASHNPQQWNALKLLNNAGEFVDAADGQFILDAADRAEADTDFAPVTELGKIIEVKNFEDIHIKKTLDLKLVNLDAIRKADFKVVVDVVNSVGAFVIPKLLTALGVDNFEIINSTVDGKFAHNPEPLKEHLTALSKKVFDMKADVGFAVDPDVDRLAVMCEDGEMFGEEYTLVAVADYVLSHSPGNTVSNMSSSRALKDVTLSFNQSYTASAVGELNVVAQMKKTSAIIGGEGNGGVIYPELHYGRDSICGIALFLSLLAERKLSVSKLKAGYPQYFMSKNKIQLTPEINVDKVLVSMADYYKSNGVEISTVDGVKADFPDQWVHLRKSNTEPIIRIYTEAKSQDQADSLATQTISLIKQFC